MGQTPGSEELKQCPDCAELVRAQARVCRFCGYRFDGRRRARAGALGGLLGAIGARREEGSLADLLEEWGTELESGETTLMFMPARLWPPAAATQREPSDGFVLLTDRRLLFLLSRRAGLLGGRAPARIGYERRLAQIGEITLERRLGRIRGLRLGLGGPLLGGVIPRGRLEELHGRLMEQRRAG